MQEACLNEAVLAAAVCSPEEVPQAQAAGRGEAGRMQRAWLNETVSAALAFSTFPPLSSVDCRDQTDDCIGQAPSVSEQATSGSEDQDAGTMQSVVLVENICRPLLFQARFREDYASAQEVLLTRLEGEDHIWSARITLADAAEADRCLQEVPQWPYVRYDDCERVLRIEQQFHAKQITEDTMRQLKQPYMVHPRCGICPCARK